MQYQNYKLYSALEIYFQRIQDPVINFNPCNQSTKINEMTKIIKNVRHGSTLASYKKHDMTKNNPQSHVKCPLNIRQCAKDKFKKALVKQSKVAIISQSKIQCDHHTQVNALFLLSHSSNQIKFINHPPLYIYLGYFENFNGRALIFPTNVVKPRGYCCSHNRVQGIWKRTSTWLKVFPWFTFLY